jgi:hypothetical protein
LKTLIKAIKYTYERVPSEVNEVVAEVTNELSSGDVLHDGKLQETNEGKNLEGTGNRNGGGSLPAGRNVGEFGSGVVNVSRKADSGGGDQVSDNTQHADAAVLDLDVSEAVELLLVTIGNKAKGIEETKRSLGTEFVFESLQGSAGGSLLGRGESGGRGDEGGKDGGLHFCEFVRILDSENCEKSEEVECLQFLTTLEATWITKRIPFQVKSFDPGNSTSRTGFLSEHDCTANVSDVRSFITMSGYTIIFNIMSKVRAQMTFVVRVLLSPKKVVA